MNRISGIKAISFDADGTLWDFEKVMRHSLGYVLKKLEEIEPSLTALLSIEKMVEVRNRVASDLKGKITNLEDIRLEAFRQTLIEIGRPDDALASHLNRIYLKHRFEDIELFDDVLLVLRKLKGKYTLGILSNGNSYPERCGLDNMFQFVVFSQDYGIEKPDPRLFQTALEKAGCRKSELLHIGDSLNTDVMGAINTGIKCVWINRKKEKNEMSFRADYEISALTELLALV